MFTKCKKQYLVKFGFILLTVLLFGSARSYALENGNKALINEMRQVRKTEHPREIERRIDLTEVVINYIPIGTTKETAIRVCEENGFKITVNPPGAKRTHYPDFEEYIACTLWKNNPIWWRWFLLGRDEYAVILYLNNSQVEKVAGVCSFHSL